MPQSLFLRNGRLFQSLGATPLGINQTNISGVGSWVAFPFIAKENLTINRVGFSHSITGGSVSSLMVAGIGTLNSETGLPILTGTNTLDLIDSESLTCPTTVAGVGQWREASLSNGVSLVAGQRYYVGVQMAVRVGTPTVNINTHANDQFFTRPSNYVISARGASGIAFNNQGSYQACFNYGYFDSGTGLSYWYNRDHTDITAVTFANIGNSQRELGFTFYMNSDFDAIEISDVYMCSRQRFTGVSAGTGNTWSCVLYDSDGSTVLVGSTFTTFNNTVITSAQGLRFPLNYILRNDKLYYFAFSGIGSNLSNIATHVFPPHIQEATLLGAGLLVTSYLWNRDIKPSSPIVDKFSIMPWGVNIIKTYGSRQGGTGRY